MIYFFDMDGVLAEYKKEHYEGNDAPFNQKENGLFTRLKPNETMTTLLKLFNLNSIPYYILTKTAHPTLYGEHIRDKKIWIKEHIPFALPYTIFVRKSKPITVERLLSQNNLQKKHVLIDDFNENLRNWKLQGGTAIKYLNGINSASSFSGYKIYSDMEAEEIYDFLIGTIENDIRKEN